MKAKEFLTENSDWFDKSPGGEKLYFESEVVRMMNDYANETLRIHAVSGCFCNDCDKELSGDGHSVNELHLCIDCANNR